MTYIDNASQEAVSLLWARCGGDANFPRNISSKVELGLPVTIVPLLRLTLRAVEQWLGERKIPFRFMCHSRAVRGCLIAFGGRGLIFVDSADSPDEQRFTVAHEAAHFLIDYWLPRQRAMEKFGEGIAQVFDGQRPATVEERFDALLENIHVGVYTDLMERDPAAVNPEVSEVENRADSIAVTLLAPMDDVLSVVQVSGERSYESRVKTMRAALSERFGLPEAVAQSYCKFLLEITGQGPSWAERVGL